MERQRASGFLALVERMRQWAVVQIFAAVVFLFVGLILREIFLGMTRRVFQLSDLPGIWLGPKGSLSYGGAGAVYSVWAALVTITLGYLAYWAYVRLFERRVPVELAGNGAAKECGAGVLIGIAFVGLVAILLWSFSAFEVAKGDGGWLLLVAPTVAAATAAFMEELAMRGIFFRILESRLGTWLALGLSAAVFGALHASNPGASIRSSAAIALSAGIVLGAAFIATRRLWLPIGLHFGVNLAQGTLLGLPVSGQPTPGLLSSQLQGPAFLTGGTFGLEASVFVPVLGLAFAIALLRYAAKKGRIQPPLWSASGRSARSFSDRKEVRR